MLHSSPGFLAAYAAAIVHRNHFFRFYQQNKPSASRVMFRQASNNCKRVLQAANLLVLIKQKSLSLPKKNLTLAAFGKFASNVLNKGKSAIPPLFNESEVFSSAFDEVKLFAKNSNLDDSGISLPAFCF